MKDFDLTGKSRLRPKVFIPGYTDEIYGRSGRGLKQLGNKLEKKFFAFFSCLLYKSFDNDLSKKSISVARIAVRLRQISISFRYQK